MAEREADTATPVGGVRSSLERIDEYRWRVPRTGDMRVEGIVYATGDMLEEIGGEAIRQVANVACLPGVVERSIGMPDIHWGYGFPIGGVAAFDPDDGGIISPGGVGYDINCGVRLLRSDIAAEEIRPRIAVLIDQIMRDVPAGVGSHHRSFRLSDEEMREILENGAAWVVGRGWGVAEDLERTEGEGRLPGADPEQVGARAVERGRTQLGTVGSGNHFIEIGHVDHIFDDAAAAAFGLDHGTVTVMIHSGSRGLGYQVCDDHLHAMVDVAARSGIALPDRQLACAPLESPEARRYLGAMNGAANFAFANRQLMAHRVREAFARVLARPWTELGMQQVYDVAHNIAKWEDHQTGGRMHRVCVHRKGATRAFPAGHPDVPGIYRGTGQPVLIPGDMARASHVLAGTTRAFSETFGSCCHGAGRRLSRHKAKAVTKGRNLRAEFRGQGVEVRAASYATIAEEVPEAYKDVSRVVDVVHGAGIGRKVARLRPLAVLKG